MTAVADSGMAPADGDAQKRAARRRKAWWANGLVVVLIGTWFAVSPFVPPYILPGPLLVLQKFLLFVTTKTYFFHLATTLFHVFGALAISLSIGAALALAAHYVRPVRLLIRGRIYPLLNSFSGIGWAVLAVIWFGQTDGAVFFAMACVLVPFIFINLHEGLESLDAELQEMGQSFTRSALGRFRLITLPLLVPFGFAALRISFGVAWKSTLLAELFGANRGLGYVVNQSRQNYETEVILAVILWIIVIVFAGDRLFFKPVQERIQRHYGR